MKMTEWTTLRQNEELFALLDEPYLVKYVTFIRSQWASHIVRMDNARKKVGLVNGKFSWKKT
jgi:hypothetical protein